MIWAGAPLGAAAKARKREGAYPRPGLGGVLAAALLALGLPVAPASPGGFPYESGDEVLVTGIVTDPDGQPVVDVEVVLEASRIGLSLRPPGRAKKEIVRGATRTDAQGAFGLRVTWSRRFDRFDLVVAVPVIEREGPRLQVLQRAEVTDRVRSGSPVAVPVQLEDTGFLDSLREFLTTLDSPDKRRVYEEMGRPDRTDVFDYVDRDEVSWWYFELGRRYLFIDDSLVDVQPFDPVRPLRP